MASVRKRTWQSGGKIRTGWVADYLDQSGKRHQQAFPTRGAADAFLVQALGEVAKGIHTPTTTSITVAEACQLWLWGCEQKGRSRSTLTNYRRMLSVTSYRIGAEKLARLTRPKIEDYRDELLKRSTRYTTDKAIVVLKSVLDEALRRGLVAQNVARPIRGYGGNRPKVGIGIDVPSAEDVRKLMDHAETTHGRSGPCSLRPLLVTAIFTGMRSGELCGLTWENVDFERRVIVVRQGADKWGTIRRQAEAPAEPPGSSAEQPGAGPTRIAASDGAAVPFAPKKIVIEFHKDRYAYNLDLTLTIAPPWWVRWWVGREMAASYQRIACNFPLEMPSSPEGRLKSGNLSAGVRCRAGFRVD
jgi:hypothetical protein